MKIAYVETADSLKTLGECPCWLDVGLIGTSSVLPRGAHGLETSGTVDPISGRGAELWQHWGRHEQNDEEEQSCMLNRFISGSFHPLIHTSYTAGCLELLRRYTLS